AKYWRRSLWPKMTQLHPASLSISALNSPVYAPLEAQCIFCAASATFDSLSPSWTATRLAAVGATTISHPVYSPTAPTISSIRARDSASVLFIFQLPATIGFLMVFGGL